LIVIIILSISEIGVSALPTSAFILFILLPLHYIIATNASQISVRLAQLITKRVHLMSEMLTAIKLIKFYAWEPYYLQKISRARSIEMVEFRLSLSMKIATFIVVSVAPVMSMLLCMAMFLLKGTTVSAATAFTLLTLYNTLRYPLLTLPSAWRTRRGWNTDFWFHKYSFLFIFCS
jgi:hypothetical protein